MTKQRDQRFPAQGIPVPSRRRAMTLAVLATALLLAARLTEMQFRMERLEADRQTASVGLYQRILGVQEEITNIRDELDVTADRVGAAAELSERLSSAENRLGDIRQAIEVQSSSLTALREERDSLVPELEQRLEERDERLMRRWEALNELVSSTQELADESRQRIQRLDAALAPRDLQTRWSELVGPVVQLAGETSVGSGILLESQEDAEAGEYSTLLLTAWHVVRDIQGDLSKTAMPVPVRVYAEDGSIRNEKAHLLCFDPQLDTALLEVRSPEAMENAAKLAPRDRLDAIRIFDGVYAVGCPLGNDPIPTYGEIATASHRVEGELYWMINAPTYIGNSGGGIFDSETHELLGVFSKIYTHGTLRPTIVPHMGLVTPMTAVYDWLEGEGRPLVAPREEDVTAASHRLGP
jgi:S1-C subfamily serine protease